MRSNADRPLRSPLPWLGGLLVLYLLLPIAALLPEIHAGTWVGLTAGSVLSALLVSLASATVSAAVIALTGIPLAYLLARGRGRWLGVLSVLVQLPLAIPPLVAGIMLLFLVGPYSLLGGLTGGALTDSFAGIVLAQTFVASPFLIVAARSAFADVAPSIEGVAATLGHRPWSRFLRVALPIAWPAIRAGLLLSWVRAFGEFGATVMVSFHPYSLPVYTYVNFGSTGLATTLAPIVAALVAAVTVLGLSLWRGPNRAKPKMARAIPPPARPKGSDRAERLTFRIDRRLGNFHLDVGYGGEGRHLVILGPSGSGKSLTLRHLAGLEREGRTEVRLGGRELDLLPPEERHVGYVPQDFALFPHLPAWAQAIFGVGADGGVAAYWMERLGIAVLGDRLPEQLSGGQRQRVAVVRALAPSPPVLLLDEPFSALDAPVRHRARRQLRELEREIGVTTVIVTHDPEEAAILADHVIILTDGHVLQSGPVGQVFSQPNSGEAARLLGIPNVFRGRIAGERSIAAGGVEIPVGKVPGKVGDVVTWAVRAESITLGEAGPIRGSVRDSVDLGGLTELRVEIGSGTELTVRTAGKAPAVGTTCWINMDAASIAVWSEGREADFESP